MGACCCLMCYVGVITVPFPNVTVEGVDEQTHRRVSHGPLARYVKLRVRMRRECRERFPRHRRWAIPTCITARASRTCRDACRDRQLSVSFEIGGGEKRSRHSRRMRNLQFYVSGKRPMDVVIYLTHLPLALHICVNGSGQHNGLSPNRHQVIIYTSAGLLLFGPSGTNTSEILIKITFCPGEDRINHSLHSV